MHVALGLALTLNIIYRVDFKALRGWVGINVTLSSYAILFKLRHVEINGGTIKKNKKKIILDVHLKCSFGMFI